jgi:hypothetical protein
MTGRFAIVRAENYIIDQRQASMLSFIGFLEWSRVSLLHWEREGQPGRNSGDIVCEYPPEQAAV